MSSNANSRKRKSVCSASEPIVVPPSPSGSSEAAELNCQKFKRKRKQMNKVKEAANKQDDGDPSFNVQNLEGCQLLEFLISPISVPKFLKDYWEKQPLLVKRQDCNYFGEMIFSSKEMDRIFRMTSIQFNEITLTRYENEKRETVTSLSGRAYASLVWNHYENGYSIRMLSPQTYNEKVWKLCSTLQSFFGTFVGSNVYLTPPGTQGFAPHWDDIEAFILQLEGKKHWKIYPPRSPEETLPRISSRDFTTAEVGSPILDTILEPGDLLYLPRGFIHQAFALEDVHSLHITVSTTQNNTWCDFLEKMLTHALQAAASRQLELRRSLPMDYMDFMGLVHSEKIDERRRRFAKKAKELFSKVWDDTLVDAAADQLAKKYLHDCLPPFLEKEEAVHTVHAGGERWKDGRIVGGIELHAQSMVRLVRKNCIRLVMEGSDVDDKESVIRLYHNLQNSRNYHEAELQSLEIEAELAPGVEYLMEQYPKVCSVSSLPCDSLEQKVEIANLLYDNALLLVSDDGLKLTKKEASA